MAPQQILYEARAPVYKAVVSRLLSGTTHPGWAGVALLLRGRGLVLGWTAATREGTTNKISLSGLETRRRCGCGDGRHVLSVELAVAVLAVHGYGCSNYSQQHYGSDDSSYDAACSRSLLWKTSACSRAEKYPTLITNELALDLK